MAHNSVTSQLMQNLWYSRSWCLLLLPFSWVLMGIAWLRRQWLQHQAKKTPLSLPVVIVGNISVGGTGKTPLLIAIIRHLQAQGLHPGVVSRGYGGECANYPVAVTLSHSPQQVGDEPLLLAEHCPVVVDPDRLRAAQYLQQTTECDVILSDDGLQHYRLPRDIEVVVVDGERQFGNGYCLPAGPLREPISRLRTVDFVLINRSTKNSSDTVLNTLPAAVRDRWQQYNTPHYDFGIGVRHIRHLTTGREIDAMAWSGGQRVHAVAGIGNPQRFVHSLQALGLESILHSYPDHHAFSEGELCFNDDLPVFITAKDAVKCVSFSHDDLWVLDIEAQPDGAFLTELTARISTVSANPG